MAGWLGFGEKSVRPSERLAEKHAVPKLPNPPSPSEVGERVNPSNTGKAESLFSPTYAGSIGMVLIGQAASFFQSFLQTGIQSRILLAKGFSAIKLSWSVLHSLTLCQVACIGDYSVQHRRDLPARTTLAANLLSKAPSRFRFNVSNASSAARVDITSNHVQVCVITLSPRSVVTLWSPTVGCPSRRT